MPAGDSRAVKTDDVTTASDARPMLLRLVSFAARRGEDFSLHLLSCIDRELAVEGDAAPDVASKPIVW